MNTDQTPDARDQPKSLIPMALLRPAPLHPTGAKEGRSAQWFGPGLIMAASGIGASDIITATVGGARHGVTLLWALGLGAFFKFVLTEGLARWQLATGTTLLEGWARYLPRWVWSVSWATLSFGRLL